VHPREFHVSHAESAPKRKPAINDECRSPGNGGRCEFAGRKQCGTKDHAPHNNHKERPNNPVGKASLSQVNPNEQGRRDGDSNEPHNAQIRTNQTER